MTLAIICAKSRSCTKYLDLEYTLYVILKIEKMGDFLFVPACLGDCIKTPINPANKQKGDVFMRYIRFLVLCSMLLLFSSTMTYARSSIVLQPGNPYMLVNGQKTPIDPDYNTAPIVEDGRVMLPIRALLEQLGGKVGWEQNSKIVILTYKGNVIQLQIGNTLAYVNNDLYILDAAPMISEGRTLLPIRFIAQAFQFQVDWDEASQTVTITT